MIEAKIEDGHVKCRCHGNRKQLTMELVGICQAVISGASAGSTVSAQRMKQMLCMALLTDMATVEVRDGSEVIVIKGVVK